MTRTFPVLLQERNHGLERILALPKPSVLILKLSERIVVRVVVGAFICVKNIIASTEVCVDVNFEMIAVEVKGMDSKYAWHIIGIYRAPNDDMLVLERSAART